MSDAPRASEAPVARPPPLDFARARRFARFLVVAVVVVVAACALLRSLALPLAASFLLAYLLLPLVSMLTRRKVPRVVAALGIALGLVTILGVVAVNVTPALYQQILNLVQLVRTAFGELRANYLPAAERYVTSLGVVPAEDVHKFFGGASLVSGLESQVQSGLTGLWHTGASVAGQVVNTVLIPVITFFLLKDFEKGRRALGRMVPPDLVAPAHAVLARIDTTLRGVLKGQAVVAGILMIMYVIGLSVIGLRNAVAIGVIAGICRLVPYFDVIVGGTLSAFVMLAEFQGWGQAASVVLVFFAVQAIDGAFVTPGVLGKGVGLHPLLVILSVLAGADWLGIWGVILAVPTIAILKDLLIMAVPYYFGSRAFTRGVAVDEAGP